jgi:hypothetical protein
MSLQVASTWLARATTIVIIASVAAPIAGARAGSGAELPLGDTCEVVRQRDLEKRFGSPIGLVPNYDPLGVYGCLLRIAGGETVPGGGQFEFVQLFPGLPTGQESARAIFEDQRAIDALSEDEVVEREDVGRQAYVNYTDGSIVVLATKKYAFSLTWKDSDLIATLTKPDENKLVALARKVVKRARK